MKKVLFVTTDKYPNGDAGAVRTHTLAKLLKLLEYEPIVVGMGPSTNNKSCFFEDVEYYSFRLFSKSIFSRILGRLLFYRKLKKFILKSNIKWDLIIVSLVSGKSMEFLKLYTKNNQITLLYDCVEWFSPEQFSIGRFHPSYVIMDRRNKIHVDSNVRVISISTFLEKYYKRKKIITSRIPVIMDIDNISYKKSTTNNKIVFTYAGSPGKKDYLDVIIEGFKLALQKDIKVLFELQIIGITEDQLFKICNRESISIIKNNIVCLGRLSREKVIENLNFSDFTVFIRSESQRYAKAGFPTKFVESLATGTPVITNMTSDLSMYLKDGYNGYIVQNESAEALANVLIRTSNITFNNRKNLYLAARHTAEKYFDFHNYITNISYLIK